MSRRTIEDTCPICGTQSKIPERAWFYTCRGCGSGVNLVGIWWKEETGEDWMELSQEEKKSAGEKFYERLQMKEWSKVVIEI